MVKSLSRRPSQVLALLPAAHFLTRTVPSPHLAAISALATHPKLRRMALGLSTIATVGIAAFAVAGC